MKDHSKILKLIETSIRELPQADAPCLPIDIPKWIAAVSFAEIRSADDACQQFAATLSWPKMNNNVLAQVHLRLECARDLLVECQDNSSLSAFAGDQLISMLLVQYWHGKGLEWSSWKYAH